jgi:hypothetical protein
MGASTVAVRHGGLVLGLLLLTPLLAHDLSRGVQRAKLVGTGLVLDAPLPASTKVPLAIDLARQLQRAPKGEVPDFSPQFRRPGPPRALHALDRALAESVRAVVTRSFRTAFALSALLALAALVPAAALRRRP